MKQRLRTLIAMTSLLPALFAVHAVVSPGEAQARCSGSAPIISHLYLDGFKAVTESPINTECNGDGFYAADFRNHYEGTWTWRASIHIQNGGNWRVYYGNRNSGWNAYHYTDSNSNSLITLCVDNGSTTYCGWGSNYRTASYPTYNRTYYGRNTGF